MPKKNRKPPQDYSLTDAEPHTGEQYGSPATGTGDVVGTAPDVAGIYLPHNGGIYVPPVVVGVGLVTGLAFLLYQFMAMSGPQAVSWAFAVVVGIFLAVDSPRHIKTVVRFIRRMQNGS